VIVRLRRAIQLHSKHAQIGIAGRLVVAALALPFGIGAVLALQRGAWTDVLLFSGMFVLAGYAAMTGIDRYARRRASRGGTVQRGTVHLKRRGRASSR
jgi:uncharacterized membrane protein